MSRLPPGQTYAGRRPDRSVLNFTVTREVADLARQYGTGKRLGEFIGRLVLEYHTRQETRREIAEALLQQR